MALNPPTNPTKTQVLSIPAGEGHTALVATRVYACPVTRAYPEFPERYVAFRQTTGEMDEIYFVEAVYPLEPHDENTWRYLGTDHRDRIRQYIIDRADYFANARDTHRFYILASDTPLPHKPRPEKNNAYRTRYTWQELTVGESVIAR